MPNFLSLYEKYLGKLTKRGRKYFALCPFHEETDPSFSIDPETGNFYCFGCGAKGTIQKFLSMMQENSMDTKDTKKVSIKITAKPEDYEVHTAYNYYDPYGNLLYVKHRYEQPKKDGIPKKTFSIEYTGKDKSLHFYNLPVLPAVDANTEIWLAEGEKCVEEIQKRIEEDSENGIEWNAVVLGFVFGDKEVQSLIKHFPQEAERFRQKTVKIFIDNDEVGEKKAETLANALKTLKVRKIEFVRFKNYERGFDIADFLQENTLSDAAALSEAVFEKKVFTGTIQDLLSLPEEKEKTIGGSFNVVEGIISLIVGTGGIGKSMLSIYMACEFLSEGKNVAMISLEDGLNKMVKRFKYILKKFTKTIPDTSIITIIEYTDEDIFELVDEAFAEHDIVFIDPIAALLKNENDNSEISQLLRSLTRVVHKWGKNLFLIHHTRKYLTGNGEITKETLYDAVRGASAIANSVKHIVLIKRHKPDPTVLEALTVKNNYGRLDEDYLVRGLLDFNDPESQIKVEPVDFEVLYGRNNEERNNGRKNHKPRRRKDDEGDEDKKEFA